MSNRELAKTLIDQIPESRLFYVVAYLQGASGMRCFFCKGELTDSTTTHVVTLDNCIIIVKNVPCTRCTQCGETFFSDEVAERLERIVKEFRSAMTEIAVVNYSDKVA